jgi:hypothetical protein
MRGGKGGHDTLAHSGSFPEDFLGRASRSGGQTGEYGLNHLQWHLSSVQIFYFIYEKLNYLIFYLFKWHL